MCSPARSTRRRAVPARCQGRPAAAIEVDSMIKKLFKKSRSRFEKGSALLVSLMIMVGLSLLGLGFVAMSETESSIAANEMNCVQAQSAAEIGAKTVIEMFQDAS